MYIYCVLSQHMELIVAIAAENKVDCLLTVERSVRKQPLKLETKFLSPLMTIILRNNLFTDVYSQMSIYRGLEKQTEH